VLKLEPREADRILVPSVELVARHKDSLAKLATRMDTAVRQGREGSLDEATAEVDAILFEEEGVARSEMAAARTTLHERRRSRSRPSRAMKPRAVSLSSPHGS
jgi:hypothetical protein